MYGQAKRMWVYRMIIGAQTLHRSWIEYLDQSDIPNSYIHENKFFIGDVKEII